jgi:hypothetical protein
MAEVGLERTQGTFYSYGEVAGEKIPSKDSRGILAPIPWRLI